MIRRRLCLLWVGLLLLTACGVGGATWDRIERDGVLRVGLDPSFPPFELLVADSVQGFDVDLAHALAAELGVETAFVVQSYDGLYDGLTVGRYDVVLSGIVPESHRTQDFAYSEPYFNAGLVLVTRDDDDLGRITDLSTHTLAVELGADGHVEAIALQMRQPDLTVLPLPSAAAALTAVADGSADAALVDHTSARLFLANEPHLHIADAAVTVEPYSAVVRIEDDELLRKLDTALRHLQKTGRLDAIANQWLDR